MKRFKIECYMPGHSMNVEIDCNELQVTENAYLFWGVKEYDDFSEERMLVAAYPIQYTVINSEDLLEDGSAEEI